MILNVTNDILQQVEPKFSRLLQRGPYESSPTYFSYPCLFNFLVSLERIFWSFVHAGSISYCDISVNVVSTGLAPLRRQILLSHRPHCPGVNVVLSLIKKLCKAFSMKILYCFVLCSYSFSCAVCAYLWHGIPACTQFFLENLMKISCWYEPNE